jgi:hypothetical protein
LRPRLGVATGGIRTEDTGHRPLGGQSRTRLQRLSEEVAALVFGSRIGFVRHIAAYLTYLLGADAGDLERSAARITYVRSSRRDRGI